MPDLEIMKYKVIFFDFGNVILSNDDWFNVSEECFEEFALAFSLDQEQMEHGFITAWPDYRDGKISEDEFFSSVCFFHFPSSSSILVAK